MRQKLTWMVAAFVVTLLGPGMVLAQETAAGGSDAYIARDPRPLVVQILLAAFLMFGFARFSARALERLAGEQGATRAARLLERPFAMGLLIALIILYG